MAMAMVPLDRLEEAKALIMTYHKNVNRKILAKVDELWQYFITTWLEGDFDIKEWNFYATDEARTNNPSESKYSQTFVAYVSFLYPFECLYVSLYYLKVTMQK